MKTRSRWISLLVAVVMVAGLLVPFVGTAGALATYSITTVASISAGSGVAQVIGTQEATFDLPTWESTEGSTSGYVYASLPSSPNGFAYATLESFSGGTSTLVATIMNGQATSEVLNGTALPAADYPVGLGFINGNGTLTLSGANYIAVGGGYYPQMLYIGVEANSASPISISNPSATSVTVTLPGALWVPSGVTGGITQTLSAPSSSVWSPGSGTIATVGNASATIAVESTPAISSSGGTVGVIDVTENAAGALYQQTNSALTFTLPPGFSWNAPALSYMWGGTTAFAAIDEAYNTNALYPDSGWVITDDSRELEIYDNSSSAAGANPGALFFKITGGVTVDESTATIGNITASIGGNTSSNVGSLVLGTYGSYGVTTAVSGTAPTIIAGIAGSNIAELEVKEGIPGSIIGGRTITLTLPSNVAWAQNPTLDTNLSTNTGTLGFTWQSEGTNGNEIQGTENASGTTSGQTSPADLFFKSMEVTPAVDFSGPIVVTVGGSEGLTGTVTLATCTSGVTAAAASTPSVQIGTASQVLGNITITENAAGNLQADVTNSALEDNASGSTSQVLATDTTTATQADLDIVAPVGVTFDTTPVVTVTSGNLQLGTVTTGTGLVVGNSTLAGNQGVIIIPIQSSSTTASTITIAAPMVTFDRTVASGPVTFKIEGTAVDETTLGSTYNVLNTPNITYSQLFPNDTTATTVNVANVGGVAGAGGTSVFTIGSTSYTLNGSTVTMDVAPYIKDSRTFLPLRYVANALGVADSNIIWNPTSQMVTIIKGGTVLQLTIGSDTMMLNGATITMDTAPEITSGRTCLPVAWVAEALGASITWNATAQTATVVSL
jgi:hypothetical protein